MLARSNNFNVVPQLHAYGKVICHMNASLGPFYLCKSQWLFVKTLLDCKVHLVPCFVHLIVRRENMRGVLLQFIGDLSRCQELEDFGELDEAIQTALEE